MRKLKKIKADYQSKNLKNPFFYRSNNNFSNSRKWLLLGVFILIAFFTWLIFAAPFLVIKKVEINGLERVDKGEIEELVETLKEGRTLVIFSQDNYFLFDKEDLHELIMTNYNFSKLNITKMLPDKLKIEISERPYAFIFQEGSEHFYASQDGYIMKDDSVSEEDYQKYFILENRSRSVTVSTKGKLNIKEDYLNFVFNLKEALAKHPDLIPEKYIIEQELNSLIVKFKDGPIVYFNTEKDSQAQADDLALVKKEKIRDNYSMTNYIDLRYGDMIYIN